VHLSGPNGSSLASWKTNQLKLYFRIKTKQKKTSRNTFRATFAVRLIAVALQRAILIVSTDKVVLGAAVDERGHAVTGCCLIVALIQRLLKNFLLLSALISLELTLVLVDNFIRAAYNVS
jgi:hypothetical protein